jgi:hypothetical protein
MEIAPAPVTIPTTAKGTSPTRTREPVSGLTVLLLTGRFPTADNCPVGGVMMSFTSNLGVFPTISKEPDPGTIPELRVGEPPCAAIDPAFGTTPLLTTGA